MELEAVLEGNLELALVEVRGGDRVSGSTTATTSASLPTFWCFGIVLFEVCRTPFVCHPNFLMILVPKTDGLFVLHIADVKSQREAQI